MKNYIGTGKKHEKFDGIVSVTIDIEKAKEFIFEYNGKKYLKFDVAEKKEQDKFGKTHSVSVWTPDGEKKKQDEQPMPSYDGPVLDDDIPF